MLEYSLPDRLRAIVESNVLDNLPQGELYPVLVTQHEFMGLRVLSGKDRRSFNEPFEFNGESHIIFGKIGRYLTYGGCVVFHDQPIITDFRLEEQDLKEHEHPTVSLSWSSAGQQFGHKFMNVDRLRQLDAWFMQFAQRETIDALLPNDR